MAYCEVEDVKARAGRLKDAWDDTTVVSDADLERFIRDAGAAVDIALSAHGHTPPMTDTTVLGAILPVVADMALLMALTATWPGGGGPTAVSDLIAATRARVEAYTAALADGNIDFLRFLNEQIGSDAGGAAAFWGSERGYSSWLDDWNTGRVYKDATGALILRSSTGPKFHKDMRL